jgi:hypothetical protein
MNSSKTKPARSIGWFRGWSGRQSDAKGPWHEEIQRTISDPEKRVLWLVGNVPMLKQFFPVSEEHRARTMMFASTPAIADALRDLAKDNVRIVFADFETAAVEEACDLCVVCPASSQLPDVFEEWLEGPIARALKPDGLVILPLPTVDAISAESPESRDDPVRAPVEQLSAMERPSLIDAFENSPTFKLLDREEAGPDQLTWLRLSKRDIPPAKAKRTFSRSARPDRFPMADFATFVRRLRMAEIRVLRTAQFAERFANFAPEAAPAEGYGVLKFDIHRGIKRAEQMAQLLSNASLPGLFLMMHRHDANASFYEHPETWSILRSLEKMGHEVGLHIDPFDLLRRHGDLLTGVTAAANEFRERGLSIETATLHGDTSAAIRTRKLRAMDFFEDGRHLSTWDGIPPAGDEQLAEHLGRYSLRDLQARSGIRYLAETTFGNAGSMIRPIVPLYISDNTRFLRTSGGRGQRVRSDRPFRISYVLARRIAVQMKRRPFLALFHPQWFW